VGAAHEALADLEAVRRPSSSVDGEDALHLEATLI
jgi:hypothetical protein